jgi:hypothetical protein
LGAAALGAAALGAAALGDAGSLLGAGFAGGGVGFLAGAFTAARAGAFAGLRAGVRDFEAGGALAADFFGGAFLVGFLGAGRRAPLGGFRAAALALDGRLADFGLGFFFPDPFEVGLIYR